MSRFSVFRSPFNLGPSILFAAVVLMTGGCGGSSPTSLEDQPIVLTGTVAYQQVKSLAFSLAEDDIIRIEIVDLSPVLVDITSNPNFIPTIGFGLGTPIDAVCATRQRLTAQEGRFFTFGLEAGDYCLMVSDAGFFPEDAIIRYTISITSAA